VGYEVTTYRIDGEYNDSRHPESVEFTSNLIEDLKRRDFTINAMAYNEREGLVDAFDGINDINNKIIRCVGEPEERFGVPLNVLIINIPNEEDVQDKSELIEAINPVITHKDGTQVFTEGCLSVPGISEEVKRAMSIKVEYFDRDGNNKIMECEGFLAVAWQHEMDHLAGHLFIEKLSILKRKKFERDWKKRDKDKK
jgi:peptide deformylase